ncbi:TPA: biogenesis of lysosome-related organelles complex 1 subunit 2 [Trebouxia sp. C0004]
MNELAAVVVAETASSCLDYILLKDMNQLAQTQYADMANFVKGLQPQMEDLLVCQEAAEPVLEAIAKLEQNLAVIESAVSQLEHESKQVMQQLGLAKDGS